MNYPRDLAAGGIGHCPLCGRFRRLLASRDGLVRVCRACAGGAPLAELDRDGAVAALSAGRTPSYVVRLQETFPAPAVPPAAPGSDVRSTGGGGGKLPAGA